MELSQTQRKILKYLFGLLSILLFTGPILICVGIALMIVPSERADRIDDYNAALGGYYTNDIDEWANGGTVNTVPLVNSSRPVEIFGEQDDVTYYSAKVVSASVPSSSTLNFNVPAAALTFARNGVATSKTRTSLAVCTNGNGCSAADMNTYCVNQYGAGSTFTGPGDCKAAGFCYECSHTVYLSEYCAVLQQTGTGTDYIQDPNHASCFFPFTADSQRYDSTTAGSAVLVTLRKSTDPFITLQRLTQGRMDLGPKVIHERMAGYGLLVAGVLMTCLLAFLIAMLLSTYNDIKEEEEEAEARRIKPVNPNSPDSQ